MTDGAAEALLESTLIEELVESTTFEELESTVRTEAAGAVAEEIRSSRIHDDGVEELDVVEEELDVIEEDLDVLPEGYG